MLTSGVNRRYVTGFTGSSGYVLITANRAILLTDFRYMSQAADEVAYFEIIQHTKLDALQLVHDLLLESGVNKVGFEQNEVSYGSYLQLSRELNEIELVPTEHLVENLRMVKDEAELAIMQEAADLADRTFSHVLAMLEPGLTEKNISCEIEMFIRQNGGSSTSFETIVASGERSALPHGHATDRMLQLNEFVKMDFGAYYKGYLFRYYTNRHIR